MGFYRQEYWSGLPFPPLEDLPHPGIELLSLAAAGGFFVTNATWEAQGSFLGSLIRALIPFMGLIPPS